MKGDSIIIASTVDPRSGAIVEEQRYSKPITGFPATFFIARWPHGGPFDKGAGHSPSAALTALMARRGRLAA